MVLEVPVTSDFSSYVFQTILELQVYGFKFEWNQRYERWSMSIYDSNDTPLIEGVPVMSGPNVLEQYVYDGLPPGKFVFADTSGENIDPGRLDLGDRVRLFYITSDDVALAEVA